jgi:hypothetical protein
VRHFVSVFVHAFMLWVSFKWKQVYLFVFTSSATFRSNSMEMKPSWEATSRSAIQEFPTLYVIPRFITVFTRAFQRSVSRAKWIQSIPPRPRSILILSSDLRLVFIMISSVFLPSKAYVRSLWFPLAPQANVGIVREVTLLPFLLRPNPERNMRCKHCLQSHPIRNAYSSDLPCHSFPKPYSNPIRNAYSFFSLEQTCEVGITIKLPWRNIQQMKWAVRMKLTTHVT